MQQDTVQATLDSKRADPLIELASSGNPGTNIDDREELAQVSVDISHDLRTSLSIITLLSGNLDLLYERLSNTEQRRMIRDIRKHTRRLNDLIDIVLQLCNDQNPLPM
jgi:signal transduction histidine kinase